MSKDEIEIDPRLERIVWKSLGLKSVRQIAEETGLAPEQIFAIKRELYEGVDDLSVAQKKQKLIVMLEEIAHDTKEDYDKAPFEFKSGLMNSSIAAMKTIMVELNRTSKEDQGRIDTLNSLRARELFSLLQEVVDTSVVEVAAQYELDEEDLFEVFNRNLAKAARKRDELPA